jgi:hypothetical protein
MWVAAKGEVGEAGTAATYLIAYSGGDRGPRGYLIGTTINIISFRPKKSSTLNFFINNTLEEKYISTLGMLDQFLFLPQISSNMMNPFIGAVLCFHLMTQIFYTTLYTPEMLPFVPPASGTF